MMNTVERSRKHQNKYVYSIVHQNDCTYIEATIVLNKRKTEKRLLIIYSQQDAVSRITKRKHGTQKRKHGTIV